MRNSSHPAQNHRGIEHKARMLVRASKFLCHVGLPCRTINGLHNVCTFHIISTNDNKLYRVFCVGILSSLNSYLDIYPPIIPSTERT